MASGWHNKLARLSQMDWEELRTRAGQEVHKRCDLLRYRLGIQPPAVRFSDSPSRQGRFFFAGSEIADRAGLLRIHLPEAAAGILRQADEICRHSFHLLGYENLDYGNEIDWHLDRVHGKRAPLYPWPRIPFLEFAVAGDHKVTWELNRHQHMVTLAKAGLLSGDEKYIRELIAQWRSWMRANPYPLGINWASTLEVAFRSLSWIWVDNLLSETPGHAEFRSGLLHGIAFHGRYIERFLSTYFSPNTHLLGEAVALFSIGTLYPQIPAAARWQQTAWRTVLHQAQQQVRPDGVYFEQSLYYHVYALDFFLHARILAERNGVDIPPTLDEVLGRMLDVVQALSQAGPPEGFGDDDGGRVFNPRRNRTEHMTDPLAIGAVLYERGDVCAARLTEESIWLFGQQAVAAFSRAVANPEPHSAAFKDGGVYVLADAQPYLQQIVVDAGPQGMGRSGHGHADALSLRLTMDGRRWLVDAGSGVYISADPTDRNAFRGTGAHNTMRVDGMDQATPDGPFSWAAMPTTLAENWIAGKTFSYFAGSHDGYARLKDPVIHRRHILKVNGGPTLVRDIALGQIEHELEVLWHFAPDLEVRDAGGCALIIPKPGDSDSGHPALQLIVPEEAVWHTEITKAMVSPAYGIFQPVPVVRCHARLPRPAEIATVLTPRSAGFHQEGKTGLVTMRQAAVQAYELGDQDEKHGFCFALDKRPWSFGPWSSDAELLYCRIRKEGLAHLIVIGGTHVAWQGQPLLTAAAPSVFFEWRKQDALMNAEPVPFSASSLFRGLTGAAALSPDTWRSASSTYAEKH